MAKKKSESEKGREVTTAPPPENTKELLIQAGKHLFSAKGFDGTTVKDISDRAGVNVSLVSYHFNGKEGLYRACLLEFGQGRLEASQRVLQAPASLEEFKIRLQMFMEEMMHWMLSNPECCQMIRREADLGLPIAEEVFASTFLQVFAALKKFIISAQEKGFVRKELDPQICASVLHLTLVEMTRHDHVSVKFFGVTLRDEKYQKKVREQFMSIYMNGLESV